MDAPLLALTSRRTGVTRGHAPEAAAVENMRQLVQLRWIAAAGQLVAILFAHFGLGVPLPIAPMLGVVMLLAVANIMFTVTLRRHWVFPGELLLALLLDMAALTSLLYLSGGANNPFISLYLLQVVLGAILLPRRAVWLLLAAGTLCFAFLSLRHLPLMLPTTVLGYSVNVRNVGEWIAFAMVASLLILFIGRISRNLRASDAYVAELAQRSVEEDGIIRMGLFASGAAHELGTPLSSLSVLVADWRRHPAIAKDPELREELDEAQAELRRCKHIVSNILHSAGQSRGEAMESSLAVSLIQEVASAWRSVRPDVPLEVDSAEIGGARIAADPSLRQAIWSLLENAADESPSGISLVGEMDDAWLVIAVLDEGPGFTERQLQRVGELYQSSKGPGHGLGLFLASNVARRLGGRLEASNLETGGAMVRLFLPFAWSSGVEER